MNEFVRQQRVHARGLAPLGEVVGEYAVKARSMMLHAGWRQAVAYRDEEIIVIVVPGPEQPIRLLHQRAMSGRFVRRGSEQLGPVGEQIEVHRSLCSGVEIEARKITPGIH